MQNTGGDVFPSMKNHVLVFLSPRTKQIHSRIENETDTDETFTNVFTYSH